MPELAWKAATFVRFERAFDTSTCTARIITDAGPAYIKAMGNRSGPHALARDLVGTRLASWFGLPTAACCVMEVEEADEIPFFRGGRATPGAAFVSRAIAGDPWSGDAKQLDRLDNPADLTKLVVFDTWTRNCDRYPPYDPRHPVPDAALPRKPNYDNVFLAAEGAACGRFKLLALDHGHCFTCGGDLTGRIAQIDNVQGERAYCLFPVFLPRLSRREARDAAARLATLERGMVEQVIAELPTQWDVAADARTALADLICDRARYLTDRIEVLLAPRCWPQGELGF